jgi:hypothetical protein
MVIREMRMDMACPEACFQSTTSEDCFQELQTHFRPSMPEFRVAVEMLYRDRDSEDSTIVLADLGPLNLFAMTSGAVSLSANLTNLLNVL